MLIQKTEVRINFISDFSQKVRSREVFSYAVSYVTIVVFQEGNTDVLSNLRYFLSIEVDALSVFYFSSTFTNGHGIHEGNTDVIMIPEEGVETANGRFLPHFYMYVHFNYRLIFFR